MRRRSKWLVSFGSLIFVIALSVFGYKMWEEYQTKSKIEGLLKDADSLSIAQNSSKYDTRVGDKYIRAYIKTQNGEEIPTIKERIEQEIKNIEGGASTTDAIVDSNIKEVIFVGSEEKEASLRGLKELTVKKITHNIETGKISDGDENNISSIYETSDNKEITLSNLFENPASAKNIILENISQQLADENLSKEEVDEKIQELANSDLSTWKFSYNSSNFSISLLNKVGSVDKVEIPLSKLYKVIDSSYLLDDDLQKYEEYLKQRSKKMVALTFDDGPNPITTPQALDILKKYNAKATFYMVGRSVKGNESIIKRVIAEGHEIGNHSWSHPVLTKLSLEEAIEQINSTTKALQEAGAGEIKTMRPPYGEVSKAIKDSVNQAFIMWNVDTLDWKNKNTESIMKNIQGVRSGSIILMHDIHQTTIDALPKVLNYLTAQGYELVTVDELLGEDLQPHKTYYRKD